MLPLSEQCSTDEAELVRFCYENILTKVGQVCKTQHKVLSWIFFSHLGCLMCIKQITHVASWNFVILYTSCVDCLAVISAT